MGKIIFAYAAVSICFAWRRVKNPENCELNLQGAKFGLLQDEMESWPRIIRLDGFEYNRIDSDSTLKWKERLNWIKRQGDEKFLPQPYEQLAKVLKEMGHESDARNILIEKKKDRVRRFFIADPRRIVHYLSGLTIGYGYRSWQALVWLVVFLAIGYFVFNPDWSNVKYIILHEDKPLEFYPFLYSFDCLVPIVDINQSQYRIPTGWQYIYRCFHIVVGWVFTTLYVVGFTGLVRK